MKTYKTQKEVEKDIVDNILNCEYQDVKFECNININANIIDAKNIDAWNINAGNIDAKNIDAGNIDAKNIDAGNIDAWNINAWNINAWNINAWNINAENISYYAFCNIYKSIECKSIKGRRDNHSEPICLDGELIIKKEEIKEMTVKEISEKLGYDVKIIK